MNLKHKKILIGIGTVIVITSIATSLVIVFSKTNKKPNNSKGTRDLIKNEEDKNDTPNDTEEVPKSPKVTSKVPEKKNPIPKASKNKPLPHYKDDNIRSNVFKLLNNELIKSPISSVRNFDKIFAEDKKMDALTLLITKLLKNGIKNLDIKNLEIILNNFNVPKKPMDIIKKVLLKKDKKINHELIDLIFNHGIAKINTEKYKNQKENLMSLINEFIPPKVKKIISANELEKMFFTGLSYGDFENLLTRIIKNETGDILGFLIGEATKELASGEIRRIYSYLPIIKKGIINATPDDWSKTFYHFKDIVNFKLAGQNLIEFAKTNKNNVQESWQTMNVIKNIANQIRKLAITKENKKADLDTIAETIPTLLNKGINSINKKQAQQISNIFEWGLNFKQGNIYKSDLESFKKGIINLFKGLLNINQKPLNFDAINNADNLDDVVKAAKLIRAFKFKDKYKKPSKATTISAQKIYSSLGNDRIAKSDIDSRIKWRKKDYILFKKIIPGNYGLKPSIDRLFKIFNKKFYDKDGKKFPLKNPKIEAIFNQFKEEKNKNNYYKWWDKIIIATQEILVYNKKKENSKIDLLKWFKTFSKHYQPVRDYNIVSKELISKFLKKNYYLSNDPLINDKITEDVFKDAIKTFRVQDLLDKIDSLFRKGLYVDKDIIEKINLNKDINSYLSNNINSYKFHDRKEATIAKYKDDVKNILKNYWTKQKAADKKATLALDLKPLDDKNIVSVQQIYNVAKSILMQPENGIWNSKGIKQDIKNSDIIKKIIPVIPKKDYGYDLTNKILNQKINKKNGKNAQLLNFVLNNIKPISDFLLNGYPRNEQDKTTFNQLLKDVINFVLLSKLNIESNKNDTFFILAKAFIDPIFDSVKKHRLDEAEKEAAEKAEKEAAEKAKKEAAKKDQTEQPNKEVAKKDQQNKPWNKQLKNSN